MAPLDSQGRSEDDFLRWLKAGDSLAWSELIQGEHGTRLYNYLRLKLPDEQDVEDVMNDTILAAVRAIQNFDGRVKLSTFLFSLANHKIVDFWRQHPKTTELTDTLIDPGMNQESIEFMEVLYQLRDEHRQVLLMRYFVGLGVDEIARILGKTYKGAESLLSRAKAELRRAMYGDKQDEGSDDNTDDR